MWSTDSLSLDETNEIIHSLLNISSIVNNTHILLLFIGNFVVLTKD